MGEVKRILIIAGPNGAGKTTFATEFLTNEAGCPTFVNADLIAAGLNPFQPTRSALRAGRLTLEMIEGYVERGESFAFETTLSGRGYARMIPGWRARGYRVQLYFLRLPTPEMALARVRNRVMEGGHAVPEAVVRRRFETGWRNFREVYMDLVDEWAIYDASGSSLVVIDSELLIGAEAALRRAAVKARRRAIETTGSVPVWRDGEIVYETEV